MKALTLTDRIAVDDAVVARELDGETLLLNLRTGVYFGLTLVAQDMWRAIHASDSLQHAIDSLQALYDVDPEVLRDDMLWLATQLVNKGLLQDLGPSSPAST